MTLFELYQALGARGLIAGSSGNASVRTRRGMEITPSGGDPETTTKKSLAKVTLEGVGLNDRTPSSEWEMHAAIYKSHPDAGCIVHAHSDACTALAALGLGLPPFHYMIVQFGGHDVRCAPYVTFGTPELAYAAVEAMRARSACLLANHGMILHAPDPAQALGRALLLESLCRQYLLARGAGKPKLLTEQQIGDAKERFRTYGPRRPE